MQRQGKLELTQPNLSWLNKPRELRNCCFVFVATIPCIYGNNLNAMWRPPLPTYSSVSRPSRQTSDFLHTCRLQGSIALHLFLFCPILFHLICFCGLSYSFSVFCLLVLSCSLVVSFSLIWFQERYFSKFEGFLFCCGILYHPGILSALFFLQVPFVNPCLGSLTHCWRRFYLCNGFLRNSCGGQSIQYGGKTVFISQIFQ